MFRIVATFDKLEFKKSAYSKTLNRALNRQFRHAARAMLREVLLHVPVYTGMARGSLIPMGRYLRVAIPIKPVEGAKKHPNKNAAAGRAASSFDFRDADVMKGVMPYLRVDIGVWHYQHNERNSYFGGRPAWDSFGKGRKKFRAYLRRNLVKNIPRITRFVTRTRVIIR